MNIKELESKLKLIKRQIREYEECRLISVFVANDLEKPTHKLFRGTTDMIDKILENLNRERKECEIKIKALTI